MVLPMARMASAWNKRTHARSPVMRKLILSLVLGLGALGVTLGPLASKADAQAWRRGVRSYYYPGYSSYYYPSSSYYSYYTPSYSYYEPSDPYYAPSYSYY